MNDLKKINHRKRIVKAFDKMWNKKPDIYEFIMKLDPSNLEKLEFIAEAVQEELTDRWLDYSDKSKEILLGTYDDDIYEMSEKLLALGYKVQQLSEFLENL